MPKRKLLLFECAYIFKHQLPYVWTNRSALLVDVFTECARVLNADAARVLLSVAKGKLSAEDFDAYRCVVWYFVFDWNGCGSWCLNTIATPNTPYTF